LRDTGSTQPGNEQRVWIACTIDNVNNFLGGGTPVPPQTSPQAGGDTFSCTHPLKP